MKVSIYGNKVFGYKAPKNFNSHFVFKQFTIHSIAHIISSIFDSRTRIDRFVKTVEIHEECYCLFFHGDNIGHFFHDIFFPFYVRYRQNPKPVYFSFKGNSFFYDFCSAAIGALSLKELDGQFIYQFTNVHITPEGRDLKEYDNYENVCIEIKESCFRNLQIRENRFRNILYGRTELARKKLLGVDQRFLEAHNIELLHFSKLSFYETVRLMAETKNFIYVVGASVFYLLFLSKDVLVLEINPAVNNSWANMFGMDRLCNFSVLITQNIQATDTPEYKNIAHDSDVIFDDQIRHEILNLLTHHQKLIGEHS